MKSPLSYQITEYDCGPTSMMNAINYLFEREEISPEIVKHIMIYCLDGYNEKGEAYKRGTTDTAMLFMTNWLNQFGKVKHFPIQCDMIQGEQVQITPQSRIAICLQQKGAVVTKLMLGEWHYVLLTGIDNEYVYLFDPYYRKRPFAQKGMEVISDEPCSRNRKISIEHFNKVERYNYSLGTVSKRAAILMYNTKTRLTSDTIEYMI